MTKKSLITMSKWRIYKVNPNMEDQRMIYADGRIDKQTVRDNYYPVLGRDHIYIIAEGKK